MLFMELDKEKRISRLVSVFHGRAFPEAEAWLVGYAALIEACALNVHLPENLALVSRQHRRGPSGICSALRGR